MPLKFPARPVGPARPARPARGLGSPARSALGLALAGVLCSGGAQAAGPAPDAALAATVQQLLERVQQLEQRNVELERRVQGLGTPAIGAASVATPAAAPPEARLQQVERQQQSLQQQLQSLARPVEPAEDAGDAGLQIEGGLVVVGQQVNAGGSADGRSQGRLNYRGDVVFTLPAGSLPASLGSASGSAVAQLRFGQGGGVALRPTHTGTVNSSTFEAAAGSDETYAVVAQAYYQLDWALDGGRFNDLPGSRVEMTIGKLDLFGFFDQNAVAGDEGAQFLNNVFVHNPLLDSGGDIGADAYGFAPGGRLAYFNVGEAWSWGASIGAFASGAGATLAAGPGQPLVIAQIELSPTQINGEPRGTYRAYAWTNGRTTGLDGAQQRHTGFGLSVDQKVGRELALFGRLGQRTTGDGHFDSAVTVGLEHGGRAWGRGNDAMGLALGWMKTGSVWRDATASGSLAGYSASGNERVAEFYYRGKVNEHLELTPDFQLIQRAGGDGNAPTVRVFGLRASLGF